MRAAIVFDVGGTSIRAGLYVKSEGLKGNCIKIEAPNFIKNDLSLEELQKRFIDICLDITNTIKNENSEYDIKDIGIAFPGPVNGKGEIIKAPTLWGDIKDLFPLRTILENELGGYNVTVINDITAAGWRYIKKFNGTFCIITISSGVGCKVFWNNELLLNKNGFGGELGHHFYGLDFKDLPCDCGKFGHIASISSGRGIEKLYEYFKNVEIKGMKSDLIKKEKATTFDIIKDVNDNDPYACFILREGIKPIADSIALLYSFIGMDKYVIMGGFAIAAGKLYIDILKEELKVRGLFGMPENEIDQMFVLAENDDFHGMIGIGKYMLERY